MPFIKRRTAPVNVSQVKLENGVKIDDDLEWIANHTLCSIIQQLSNLNNSASCLFGELCNEARAIHNKTNNLKSKVDEMKERYKRWNKIKGGASFDKGDKEDDTPLSHHFDQQLLCQANRSPAISSMYTMANPPPAIAKTDPYREDGRTGLSFYTDPTFFFVTWSSEMQKIEKEHQNRKTRRQERKTKRHDGDHRPKEIKRKQDELIAKANRDEFRAVEEHGKKKRHKKKKIKMEGFSNVAWEKEHKNSENKQETQESMSNEKSEKENSSGEIPSKMKKPTMRKPPPENISVQTTTMQNGEDTSVEPEFDDLPPPPPGLELPPPPPDPPGYSGTNNRQSFALPPAPPDFFRQAQSVVNERESFFPPPPPPDDIEEEDQPPPLLPRRSQNRQALQNNRISTFVLDFDDNIPETDKLPDNLPVDIRNNVPLPPAPPPPPPPSLPQGLPANPVSNGPASTPKKSGGDSGGVPTENALLAMKQKLQTRERNIKPSPLASTNAFDVHTIMNNALQSHRAVMENSSSDDDSEFTDSDSDWD